MPTSIFPLKDNENLFITIGAHELGFVVASGATTSIF